MSPPAPADKQTPLLLRPRFPFDPARTPFFYGWVIVVVGTLGIGASIPGQTTGVSVFTDHLLAATGLTRLELSNAYLVGTVTSGLLLPRGGRLLDRIGARPVAVVTCVLLALTLLYLSRVDHVVSFVQGALGSSSALPVAGPLLTVGFVSLRFNGQGMLTMLSRNMLGKWFERRRGLIAGISGVFVSFAFASAPLLLSLLIEALGWRGAWGALALAVGIGMTVLAWLFYRDNPEECGLQMDGARAEDAAQAHAALRTRDLSREEAIRYPIFWGVTLALALHGLVLTGFTFHIVDIGREGGLAQAEAVTLFLPMAVLSTTVGLIAGHLADRVPIKLLIATMLILETAGIVGASHLGVLALKWLAIGGLGAAGGFFAPLSTVAMPKLFGRAQLGAITGVSMMCIVVASALGPSALALSRQWLGSYAPSLYAICVLPVVIAVIAAVGRDPQAARR